MKLALNVQELYKSQIQGWMKNCRNCLLISYRVVRFFIQLTRCVGQKQNYKNSLDIYKVPKFTGLV